MKKLWMIGVAFLVMASCEIKTDNNSTVTGIGSDSTGIGSDSTNNVSTCVETVGSAYEGVARNNGIAAGIGYSVVIRNCKLYAWGENERGQLGIGSTVSKNTPTLIKKDVNGNDISNINWKSVVAGYAYSLAITTDGKLYAWGSNDNGQLGDGTTTQRNAPTLIIRDSDNNDISNIKWDKITAGFSLPRVQYGYSLALTEDGKLYSWGQAGAYLGNNGASGNVMRPAHIATDKTWKYIAAKQAISLGIANDGKLYVWGRNSHGQIGSASDEVSNIPHLLGFKDNNERTTFKKGFVYYSHGIAIDINDELYAWGQIDVRDIGVEEPILLDTLNGAGTWDKIAIARNNLGIKKSDKFLYKIDITKSTDSISATSTQITRNANNDTLDIQFTDIIDTYQHVLAVSTDGQLYSWGENSKGELGRQITGDEDDYPGMVSF